jgi:hypothetical protein
VVHGEGQDCPRRLTAECRGFRSAGGPDALSEASIAPPLSWARLWGRGYGGRGYSAARGYCRIEPMMRSSETLSATRPSRTAAAYQVRYQRVASLTSGVASADSPTSTFGS